MVTQLTNYEEIITNTGPITKDQYNEMIISIAKNQKGKNGLAILETLNNDGLNGQIRLYSDTYPEGKIFDIEFNPISATAKIIE